jgi:hypothetical protein
MLAFDMAFLPLLIICMVGFGVRAGLKSRARLLQVRARHDRQRFLRMGFLRKHARSEEQRFLRVNPLRKEGF